MSTFRLHLAGLCLSLACLASVTCMSLIAALVPTHCGVSTPNNRTNVVIVSSTCSQFQGISHFSSVHRSYLQSIHTIAFQLVMALSLLVMKPALQNLVWRTLKAPDGTRAPSLESLQARIKLSMAPNLMAGFGDAIASYSRAGVSHYALLAIALGLLSISSPLAVSPIYRPRIGSTTMLRANVTIGGGIGPNTPTSYAPGAPAAEAVGNARVILNSATITGTRITLRTYSSQVATFIEPVHVAEIASANVPTVIAYQSVDCGPNVMTSLGESVTVSSAYWDPIGTYGTIKFGQTTIGEITDDPQMSVFYINSTNSIQPGWLNSTTTVIFLAANGTIEGAQNRLPSLSPVDSRIKHIDVLACTSAISLALGTCMVSNGRVASCSAYSSSDLPPNSKSSPTGGLENILVNPISVATTLSASPVTAYYSSPSLLPMYNDITPALLDAYLAPLSFLTQYTASAPYSVPLAYVYNTLFGQTAVALVQGLLAGSYAQSITIPMRLIAVFQTSTIWLQILLFAIASSGALLVAFHAVRSGTLSSKREGLDCIELLAISRNPQLDRAFEPYTDHDGPAFPKALREVGIRYRYVPEVGRHALELQEELASEFATMTMHDRVQHYPSFPVENVRLLEYHSFPARGD